MLTINLIHKDYPPIKIDDILFNNISEILMKYQNIIPAKQKSEISLVLCNNLFIQKLNKKYRKQDKATNVLSFPTFDKFDKNKFIKAKSYTLYLGDIIISIEKILQESKIQKKDNVAHFTHLLIHGILHLLGYNHVTNNDAEIMEKLEILILDKLGYKNPYQ